MRSVALLSLAAALAAAAPGADSPAAFTDYGTISDAGMDGQGRLWLTLWEPHVRFLFEQETEEKTRQLEALLRRAGPTGRALTLQYDAPRGRYDSASRTLAYRVCAVQFDDVRFDTSQPCEAGAPTEAESADGALALARAYLVLGDTPRARRLLAGLRPPADAGFRALFLRTRAQVAQAAAELEESLSPASDRALADALADYRALAAIEPTDVEVRFDIGNVLLDLGGYAEALAVHDEILAAWPGEEYRVTIRRGAVYRAQGDYGRALQVLDQLIARRGPQTGMRFHYHRGWTLSLLGRFDDAVRAYDEGLASQPDYSSTYHRRACARAALGRIEEALSDVAEATRLYAGLPGGRTSRLIQPELREAAALQAALTEARAAGRTTVANGCASPYWRRHEAPRPRSALLLGN
ncbi:MAG TPA: tetratricopeptide repeat protein [Allosphingosinicella sp.]